MTKPGGGVTYSYFDPKDGRFLGEVERNTAGQIVVSYDADGNVTTYAYDPDGQIAVAVDSDGTTTTYVYDGNTTTETTDEAGTTHVVQVTRMTYDDAGRVTGTTVYDGDGNVIQSTDGVGNVTTTTYDADGIVQTETDAAGDPILSTRIDTDSRGTIINKTIFDADGNLISETDSAGNTTNYTYDGNELINETVTDKSGKLIDSVSDIYDADGNLLTSTNSDGISATYTYDTDGTRHETVYGPTDNIASYSVQLYDPTGQVVVAFSDMPCFCVGTHIMTEHGEITVEELRIGDKVLTTDRALRPIRWIGNRRLNPARHPVSDDVYPIRIVAGALDTDVPRRDLLISPDHAILLHSRLVPVRLLLNGATVRRENRRGDVIYFHIELDSHDILLAEGVAAESYLDTGNRAAFENADLPLQLRPDFAGNQERREAGTCTPLATAPGDVEPIWKGLAARAEALGWTLPDPPDLVNEPDLHIVANGRRIDAVVAEDGRYIFAVPGCKRPPRLVSRAVRPSDLCAWLDDRRRLGVQVRRMIVSHGQDVVDIPMDHPMLAEGWWAAEQGDRALCRWTDGNAALAPMGFGLIDIRLAGRPRYPAGGQHSNDTPPVRCEAGQSLGPRIHRPL